MSRDTSSKSLCFGLAQQFSVWKFLLRRIFFEKKAPLGAPFYSQREQLKIGNVPPNQSCAVGSSQFSDVPASRLRSNGCQQGSLAHR